MREVQKMLLKLILHPSGAISHGLAKFRKIIISRVSQGGPEGGLLITVVKGTSHMQDGRLEPHPHVSLRRDFGLGKAGRASI